MPSFVSLPDRCWQYVQTFMLESCALLVLRRWRSFCLHFVCPFPSPGTPRNQTVQALIKHFSCSLCSPMYIDSRRLAIYKLAIAVVFQRLSSSRGLLAVLAAKLLAAKVVDNFFCIFFSFEISVRFLAYRKGRDALKETWKRKNNEK